MLSGYSGYCCPGYILFSLFLWGITVFAYRANANLAADDPRKKEFRFSAVLWAPITFPFLVLGIISLYAIKAFFYGLFLVALTILLVVFRKPESPIWLEKLMTKIGNFILETNTQLIQLLLSPWTRNTQPS